MSAIFFGPPGTSKTELSSLVAEYLGWPRLTIDPGHFVRGGFDRIQLEADQIFSRLAVAEQIVVLLDEFDEMVLDRAQGEVLSRFLTTSMLPRLASINRNRKIVFIVATNYIDKFDIAISRRGRFDFVVQVMPPTATQKLLKWPILRKTFGKLHESYAARKQLEALTFDECRELTGKLHAMTLPACRKALADTYSKCTLQSINSMSKPKVTWAQSCVDQISKNRIP